VAVLSLSLCLFRIAVVVVMGDVIADYQLLFDEQSGICFT
jgi:hypothetical protein